MIKFDFLEIISGLEADFWKIFTPREFDQFSGIYLMDKEASRPKKSKLALQSLFVLWESLYNSFDNSRRLRWTNYWITLPFSSHLGLHGYPGSGYSGFVYLNAPRYKLGLDLMLDPPTPFIELILNGDFSMGSTNWTFSAVSFVSNEARFSNHGTLSQYRNLVLNGTYRLEFDIVIRDKTTHLPVSNSVAFYYYVATGQSYYNVFVSTGHYFFDNGVFVNGRSRVVFHTQYSLYEVCLSNVSFYKL